MWVSSKLVELFQISKDTVAKLQEELSVLKAERDLLKNQLVVTDANFNWFRLRVNALEMEKAQLVKKAYGIDVPVPEVARQPQIPIAFSSDLFGDVGDKIAKELGLPSYDN